MFFRLVRKYRHLVDLSLSHIDGTHTPAVRGGESVEYQGRKKCKTTNSIYFTDRQGLPLAMSEPQKGNHADLYEIKESVDSIAVQLDGCGISLDGIFALTPGLFNRLLTNMGSSLMSVRTLEIESLLKSTSWMK